jgi:large subunit ribosomal protein L23
VNIIRVAGKTKRIGRRLYSTPPWKKALVTLRDGDKIEFFEGV